MQNNLDKYFKEKLDHRKFEMKDAYWEQAQKLLEEDEKNRRRRIIGWWSGGAFAVILLLVGFYFLLPLENSNPEISQKLNENNIENFNEENVRKKAGEDFVKNNIDGGVSAGNQNEKRDGIIESANEKKVVDNGVKIDDETSGILSDKKSVFSNDGINEDKFNHKLISNNEVVSSGQELTLKVDLFDLGNEGKKRKENELTELKVEDAVVVEKGESELAEIILVDKIDDLLIFVEKEKGEVKASSPEISEKNKWSFGVTAAQFFQPTPNGNEQTPIAFEVGALARRELKKEKGIYFLTGINYQKRTGTFERSKIAETRNYRFGLELDTNMLRPNAVHTLSLPLLFGKEKGRNAVEVGISLNYLLGVYGERGGIARIPDSDPPMRGFVPAESGWINEDGFKKWTNTAHLNYRFRINTQWSFGLSANYIFGGILKEGNSSLGVNKEVVLKEDDEFMFGIRAIYLFK